MKNDLGCGGSAAAGAWCWDYRQGSSARLGQQSGEAPMSRSRTESSINRRVSWAQFYSYEDVVAVQGFSWRGSSVVTEQGGQNGSDAGLSWCKQCCLRWSTWVPQWILEVLSASHDFQRANPAPHKFFSTILSLFTYVHAFLRFVAVSQFFGGTLNPMCFNLFIGREVGFLIFLNLYPQWFFF